MFRRSLQAIFFSLFLLGSAGLARGVITVSGVKAVDVTPGGFSVIWQTSEPAAPGISVYSDLQGTGEITSQLEIIYYPLSAGRPEIIDPYLREESIDLIRSQAKALGLMKIRVEGAAPQTTYYYRIQARGAEEQVTYWPQDSLASVTTALENSFISDSKQLLVSFYTRNIPMDSTGWIVEAFSSEGPFGVSALAGDGAAAHQAYINLSNLFGTAGLNWSPIGTKEITLEIKRGGGSYQPARYTLSLEFSQTFSVASLYEYEVDLYTAPGDVDGVNGVDLTDAILALQALTGQHPQNIFSGADINGDGRIGPEEIIYILQKIAGIRP